MPPAPLAAPAAVAEGWFASASVWLLPRLTAILAGACLLAVLPALLTALAAVVTDGWSVLIVPLPPVVTIIGFPMDRAAAIHPPSVARLSAAELETVRSCLLAALLGLGAVAVAVTGSELHW
jgi:hypothetical protein